MPGDGLLWTDPLNWSGDALPGGADVIFANPLAPVGSRILIPGQANVTGTGTIVGLLGNNGLDFIRYDGTTLDNGVPLGVRDMRKPGNLTSPATYTDNTAESVCSVCLRRRRHSCGARGFPAPRIQAAPDGFLRAVESRRGPDRAETHDSGIREEEEHAFAKRLIGERVADGDLERRKVIDGNDVARLGIDGGAGRGLRQRSGDDVAAPAEFVVVQRARMRLRFDRQVGLRGIRGSEFQRVPAAHRLPARWVLVKHGALAIEKPDLLAGETSFERRLDELRRDVKSAQRRDAGEKSNGEDESTFAFEMIALRAIACRWK